MMKHYFALWSIWTEKKTKLADFIFIRRYEHQLLWAKLSARNNSRGEMKMWVWPEYMYIERENGEGLTAL